MVYAIILIGIAQIATAFAVISVACQLRNALK